MGFTAIEKVLARASCLPHARAGDVVHPDPDMVMIHDGVVREIKIKLDEIGINRIRDPDKLLMVTDHEVVYGNQRSADKGVFNRKAAAEWKAGRFYDAGRGGMAISFLWSKAWCFQECFISITTPMQPMRGQ